MIKNFDPLHKKSAGFYLQISIQYIVQNDLMTSPNRVTKSTRHASAAEETWTAGKGCITDEF